MSRFYILLFLIIGGYFLLKYRNMKRRLERYENKPQPPQSKSKKDIQWDAEDIDYEEIKDTEK